LTRFPTNPTTQTMAKMMGTTQETTVSWRKTL